MSWIDHLILWGYVLSTVMHGAFFYKRADNVNNFMAGGGKIPAWAAGFSVLGTFLSSVTFLTYPGRGCTENWNTLVFALTMPLGALFASMIFIPFYRRMGIISIFGYLEDRFNVAVRIFGNVCFFLFHFGRAGFALYLVCTAMVSIMGLGAGDPDARFFYIQGMILAVGAVVIVYTLLGGIEAVIWTDVVQVIILVCGALLCMGLLMWQTPGGASEIVSSAWDKGKLSLGAWDKASGTSQSVFDWSLVASTFFVTFLFGAVENLKNYNFEMVYVQRYATVDSIGAARRSVWLSVVMYIGLTAVFLFIGTELAAYYRQPELAGQIQGMNYEEIFPHYISTLPPGVRGLLLIAILAAGISTIDSSFNTVATIFYTDLWKRYFRAKAIGSSDEAKAALVDAKVLRAANFAMGGLSVLFAMLCIGNKNILDLIWGFAGLTGSGLVGMYLIGMFLPRARGRDALISIVLSTPVVVAFFLWSKDYSWMRSWNLPACPLNNTLTLPLGVALHVVVGWFSSLIGRTLEEDAVAASSGRRNLTVFGFRTVEARGTEMVEPGSPAESPVES